MLHRCKIDSERLAPAFAVTSPSLRDVLGSGSHALLFQTPRSVPPILHELTMWTEKNQAFILFSFHVFLKLFFLAGGTESHYVDSQLTRNFLCSPGCH